MKFPREPLAAHIRTLAGTCPVRAVIPILQNIAFAEKKGQLILTSQNQTSQLTIATGLPAEEGIRFTVPGKKMADIISAMDGEQVELTIKDDKLTVKSGKNRFNLPMLPFESYPFFSVPTADNTFTLELDAAELFSALSRVYPASGKDDSRTFLNGVAFDFDGDVLTLVATDASRLHRQRITLMGPVKQHSVIFPVSEVSHLLSAFPDPQGTVFMKISPFSITFRQGSVLLMTRLIDAKYPDWRRVIPQNTSEWFTVERASLLKILKMSNISASEERTAVTILDTCSDESLEVSSHSSNGENFLGNIECQLSKPRKLAFVIPYLVAALQAVTGSQLQLCYDNERNDSSIVFEEDNFLAIVMPYRID